MACRLSVRRFFPTASCLPVASFVRYLGVRGGQEQRSYELIVDDEVKEVSLLTLGANLI